MTSAGLPASLDLTVTRRLLWVGGAVYPLQNVARVYTFVLHPRRKEATLAFLKRSAVALLTGLGFTLLAGTANIFSRERETLESLTRFVWFAVAAGLLYFIVDWLRVLTAPSPFVLAVESNGQSTALVTGESGHLNRLVQQIAHAIENPDAELRVRVERLTISNPRNYYFGDAVNMYGGSNNVGMTSA
ncbi:hypothetical protein CP980_16010 [Streptomyces vinaceus]|uniref:Uncharacterized protein n=1 Tax=Streptomyces vinaceus TaxID=1960 RepID=A0A5J6JCF1_STRVI|nr:DUF6232 family protein [Streptomyces vinaceus]QEV46404.1 hypothetical protein CP980_16010 [Streptomyces vinaceus]GHE66390.1 hypothetical protein GCM10017778_59240 [Streptomyces vinaceus]